MPFAVVQSILNSKKQQAYHNMCLLLLCLSVSIRVFDLFFCFVYRARIRVAAFYRKGVYIPFAYSSENTVLQAVVLALKSVEELFHILALGVFILGARVGNNRSSAPSGKILHVALGGVDKWAYKRYFSV